MSLTRRLVGIIRSKPVTQDDLDRAALFVLDTLSCALGALKTAPARHNLAEGGVAQREAERLIGAILGLAEDRRVAERHAAEPPARRLARSG